MIKVLGADVEYMKFSAGEPHVKVTNINSKLVKIYWKFENFEEFMSVAMIASVVFRATKKVILDLPYVPFSRQDRATTVEQPYSLLVFCIMLKTLKIDKLEVCDVHSDVFKILMTTSDFNIEYNSQIMCAALVLPVEYLMPQHTVYDCVISPDKGAVYKAKSFADAIKKPLICATKVRDSLTGQLSSPTIDFGDLQPKVALIPDDILDAGGTFIQLAQEIKKQFPEIVLDLYITHGIFAKGTEELDKYYRKIYCYNDMRKIKGE